MRDTLENLYFGNITPNDQIVKSGTALKKAMEHFILGFRLGVRMILEALDEDDGCLIDPNKEG